MLNRIWCAIFGHDWQHAGGGGYLELGDKRSVFFQCHNCLVTTHAHQPGWYARARSHKRIRSLPDIKPDPFLIGDGDFDKVNGYINEHYPIWVLAEIYKCSIEDLKELGYREDETWLDGREKKNLEEAK